MRSGGTSIIDYVICSLGGLEKIINMQVIHPWKAVRVAWTYLLISEWCSIPDHTIIVTDVAILNIQEKNYYTNGQRRKARVRKMRGGDTM